MKLYQGKTWISPGHLGHNIKMRKYDLRRGRRRKRIRERIKKYFKNQKADAELILFPGRFGRAREVDKHQICMPPKLQHFHKHSRIYLDASITFEADNRHMEFTQMIGNLIFNAKKVDEHFVINSYKEGGKNLSKMTEFPTNMKELGENIQVSGSSRSFEMRRLRKKDKNKGNLMRTN